MQQKRNKKLKSGPEPPTREPATIFFKHWTPQDAREYLAIEIAKRDLRGSDTPITLPVAAARQLFKKNPSNRPAETRGHTMRKRAVVAFAKQRKDELHAQGMKATGASSAEDQAAEEARVLAHERYGISLAVTTIKRLMQSDI